MSFDLFVQQFFRKLQLVSEIAKHEISVLIFHIFIRPVIKQLQHFSYLTHPEGGCVGVPRLRFTWERQNQMK